MIQELLLLLRINSVLFHIFTGTRCMVFRNACSIQFDDKVIITGGIHKFTSSSSTTVSVYTMEGWIEDLPDLLQGRNYHGCGHYNDDNNEEVINTSQIEYLQDRRILVGVGWLDASPTPRMFPQTVLLKYYFEEKLSPGQVAS